MKYCKEVFTWKLKNNYVMITDIGRTETITRKEYEDTKNKTISYFYIDKMCKKEGTFKTLYYFKENKDGIIEHYDVELEVV